MSRVIKGHFGDEFCSQSLALVLKNQNNQETEHVQNKTNATYKMALINNHTKHSTNQAKREDRQSLV